MCSSCFEEFKYTIELFIHLRSNSPPPLVPLQGGKLDSPSFEEKILRFNENGFKTSPLEGGKEGGGLHALNKE